MRVRSALSGYFAASLLAMTGGACSPHSPPQGALRDLGIAADETVPLTPRTLLEDADLGWYLDGMRQTPAAERSVELRSAAQSAYAITRLRALHAAVKLNDPAAKKVLESALRDPDEVVRRVAAEYLFGRDALGRTVARQYGYADVLRAERSLTRLADPFRKSNSAAQYELTQRMIALGHRVTWGLRRLAKDDDEAMSLSCHYALQQIERRHKNTPLQWFLRLKRRLEKKITVDFKERNIDEVAQVVSELTGAKVSRDTKEWDWPHGSHRCPTSFSCKDTKAEDVIALACRRLELEYYLCPGRVVIGPCVNWDGCKTHVLDVRDMEAAGFRPDWMSLLSAKFRDADTDLWMSSDCGLGPFCEAGFIVLTVRTNQGNPEGLRQTMQIEAYLNELRGRKPTK